MHEAGFPELMPVFVLQRFGQDGQYRGFIGLRKNEREWCAWGALPRFLSSKVSRCIRNATFFFDSPTIVLQLGLVFHMQE